VAAFPALPWKKGLMKNVRMLVAAGICLALVLGLFSVLSTVQAKKGRPGGCVCPMYYAPVECDNGRVYSNQCVADCNKAKNCVPIGPGPIEL
jgi:hypothetical protein